MVSFSVFAVVSVQWLTARATFVRGAGHPDRHTPDASFVGLDVKSVDRSRTLASLLDVESDLQTEQEDEEQSLGKVERQIASLTKQRESMRHTKARRGREMNFLQTEIARLRKKLGMNDTATVADVLEAKDMLGSTSQSDATTDSSAQSSEASEVASSSSASAEEAQTAATVSDAEQSQASSQSQETATRALVEANSAASQQTQMVSRAQAEADAQAHAKTQADAQAAAIAAAVAAATKAQAEADARAQAKAAAEAKAKADAIAAAQAKAEAEAKAKAEAEAKAKAEAEAAERAKEEAAEKAAQAAQDEKERKKNEMADHADDSFKDFMKEEDGEDEQNDPDYEESANALAGAIGWKRDEVEKNADVAVKSLTEAIGGKKVIRSLQGMMAGVR